MKKILIWMLLPLFLSGNAIAQSLNSNWKEDLNNSLYQFMQCDDPLDDISPCNKFVGEVLKVVYEINDFYSEDLGRYMLANEIADYLAESDTWTLLGSGDDQSALTNAQGYANQKKAIVAVLKASTGSGHVALVLPGELQTSGSWGKRVPNSASFFIYKPDSSYINKMLSYAFSASVSDDVLIYGRDY